MCEVEQSSFTILFRKPFSVTKLHLREIESTIIYNEVIEQHFFDGNLNSTVAFLENDLPLPLENYVLQLRWTMFFLENGTPTHYRKGLTNFLNEQYPNRWI